MTTFDISTEVIEKCNKFANDSVNSSIDKYSKRGQYDSSKIIIDIRNGKIGEVYAHAYLLKRFPDLSFPDFEIYEAKNKNWDPDLKSGNVSIAVKTQDFQTAMHYGDSWVFQFGNGKFDCDKGIFGESNSNKYVALVSTNFAKRTGKIKAFVKVDWLHKNNLFKEMKKESLRNNKLAVYYDDLIDFDNELFQ